MQVATTRRATRLFVAKDGERELEVFDRERHLGCAVRLGAGERARAEQQRLWGGGARSERARRSRNRRCRRRRSGDFARESFAKSHPDERAARSRPIAAAEERAERAARSRPIAAAEERAAGRILQSVGVTREWSVVEASRSAREGVGLLALSDSASIASAASHARLAVEKSACLK